MTPMRECERLRLPVKRVQVKSKGKGKSRMEQFREATQAFDDCPGIVSRRRHRRGESLPADV